MQKYGKLRKSSEFDSVKKYGDGFSDSNLVIVAMDRDMKDKIGESRLGFIVSKKIGGSTIRNKYKRRMKESAKSIPIIDGLDIVFIAKQGILKSGYQELACSMEKLLNKASLLRIR